MNPQAVWFTIIFVVLLLVAFVFGTSAIFRQLKADSPATPAQGITETAPWQAEFPLLP
jgi:hypothetical protein